MSDRAGGPTPSTPGSILQLPTSPSIIEHEEPLAFTSQEYTRPDIPLTPSSLSPVYGSPNVDQILASDVTQCLLLYCRLTDSRS